MSTPIHPPVPSMERAENSILGAARPIPDRTGDPPEHVTTVASPYRVWAECTCGWKASQRQTRPAAEFDARQHTAETGHK